MTIAAGSAGGGAVSGTGERRALRFESMADILREVESLAGRDPVSVGAWTPAQNIDHIRILIRFSREGGDVRVPLMFRLLGPLMKSRFMRATFKPGIKAVDEFMPADGIRLDDAVRAFREEIGVASRPGTMTHTSPVFGKMSHEDWVMLHCRHAELHLGHVLPGGSV